MSSEIVAAYRKHAEDLLRDPNNPEALANQYTILSTSPRTKAQLALAKRCAELAPNEFIAVFNYASALSRNGMESVEVFKRALELAPEDRKAIALHHVGLAYHDRGEYTNALRYYYQAKAANADQRLIGQSIAIAKLAMGRLREGLYEFEVKHHIKPRKPITESGIPWWNGEDLSGKSVILTHEQGFGDTLQFIRFASELHARCGGLVFSGSEAIAPLIAEQFDFFDDVINEVGPFEADFVTSPMASAALMGIEYSDITGSSYMTSAPIDLPVRGAMERLKVGLSWKGSPGYANDALRSALLLDFAPLFDLPGAAFYSLQVRPDGAQEISDLGLDGFIADLGSTFGDWRDTAAAIAAMDVVVATDSANAHMAGALGKPVLLLLGKNPCWRWMSGDRTPWYENTKIYRQKVVDEWPMLEVRRELERLVKAASMPSPLMAVLSNVGAGLRSSTDLAAIGRSLPARNGAANGLAIRS